MNSFAQGMQKGMQQGLQSGKQRMQDLAKNAGVGISSVRRLEGMTTNEVVSEGLRPSTVQKIVEALEAAGVDFLQESDDRIGIMFSRFLPVNH